MTFMPVFLYYSYNIKIHIHAAIFFLKKQARESLLRFMWKQTSIKLSNNSLLWLKMSFINVNNE